MSKLRFVVLIALVNIMAEDLCKTPQKRKKRVKYEQKYKSEYRDEFKCINKSSVGDTFAFCNLCRCDVNITHGGRDDLRKHCLTQKHVHAATAAKFQPSVSSFAGADRSAEVTCSELLFTSFLVEHNIPLSASDHAGLLFRKMFPDSELAKKYGSAHTTTTCTISALARSSHSNVVSALERQPFSVSTDGSNDSDFKLYPIVVRYQNSVTGHVECTLLSLPNLELDATGENIAGIIDKSFTQLGVPWANCVAFGYDNVSVMTGRNKGCVTHMQQKYKPTIALAGCPCHLIHIAAEKASHRLPVSIDDLLIDIYYYLDKSSKRIQKLRDFQQLCNVEVRKILKHVCSAPDGCH